MNREKPICPHCKSESVTADATAYWDAFNQSWELNGTFDTYWCEGCGGSEIHPEWVSVEAVA
jgi:RNA polymerase subunit RPABC4/transcription elongation factor Spt4